VPTIVRLYISMGLRVGYNATVC